ncbi:MAG: deoR 2 [Bacillota bacterium]|jgi:DNA-binding transcriptional regulator LsrR (DeoR family)|nr:deoR 2 [Bacillota bacterium]
MDHSDIQKLVEISKMYHHQGLTQEKIANIFGISRSAVSMYLTEAKNSGIVQVQVKDPSINNRELAERFEKEFALRHCIVVPNGTHNDEVLLRVVNSQATRFAADLFVSHSSIGIAWGHTCYDFMQSFPSDTDLCDVSVVPMVGASPLLTQEHQLNESIRMFADKLRGYPLFIYAPGFVETLEDKRRLIESTFMQPVLDRWQNMDYAVLGIGKLQERDELRQFRCGGQNILEEIAKYSDLVVGDLCARRFNIKGEFIECDYNNKIIGVDGTILKATKNVMAIAVGSSKIFAIIGALRTKVIHYFVIDENTAKQVLNLLDSGSLPS